MHDYADALAGRLIGVDQDLEREFEDRIRESSALAFRVAFAVLHHRQDAEDVAQEALARAFRKFHQLRERDRFRSWLVRMTWRLALDRQRSDRRRKRREFAERGFPVAQSVAASMEIRHEALEMWNAIDALPDKLRVVVVMAAIEGYNIDEVATLLQLPPGTVKSRLFLARRRLRSYFECDQSED